MVSVLEKKEIRTKGQKRQGYITVPNSVPSQNLEIRTKIGTVYSIVPLSLSQKGARAKHPQHTRITILKDIPQYRNYSNMRVYGPFKAGETFKLPTDEAKFLVSEGMAVYPSMSGVSVQYSHYTPPSPLRSSTEEGVGLSPRASPIPYPQKKV